MPANLSPRLLRAYRIVLGLTGGCVGLLAVVAYLLWTRNSAPVAANAALQDDELRQQVIAQLVSENRSLFDSHVDADVGRVQLPRLDNYEVNGVRVTTNRFGMRERDYEMPKPEGVVRIVILGDSMVFGFGVEAEDRLGAQLEAWLTEGAPAFAGRIECLHLGVPSWNIRSETAYLRRQLNDLQPDLVIQLVVPNDIDDTAGTRGFGVAASFSSQRRQFADSRITAGFPAKILGVGRFGLLRLGLDYESRSRYAAAVEDIKQLMVAVEKAGGSYRLLVHYRKLISVAGKFLGRELENDVTTYLSSEFGKDRSFTIASNDPHWNRDGHGRVARVIYGLITRDNLLPQLALPAWPEADAEFDQIAVPGAEEAARELTEAELFALYRRQRPRPRLDLRELNPTNVSQIHGGLDREGRVSPYASFLLRNDSGRQVRILGQNLPHLELEGARVAVFVEAEKVGELVLDPGSPIDQSFPLPSAFEGRRHLSVRFQADDYVYAGPNLQHCVVFILHELAIR